MSEQGCPTYLIAGGRGRERLRGPDPIAQVVIRSAGVPRPRVAYVGAASGDNPAFRLLIGGILKKAGAGEVTLAPLCGRKANADAAREVLEAADLIFVSGGDVEEGMRVLEERGMIPILRRLHADGTPFFGISAGSIMLARSWVRWTDPKDDDSAELFPCLGFAPVLCDTHGEGDGWGELKAALTLRPGGAVGYGIVSGTALVVQKDGTVGAVGGEVHVFKRRKAGVVQVESLAPERSTS
jgi:cyanophycinase-like exopeptidase